MTHPSSNAGERRPALIAGGLAAVAAVAAVVLLIVSGHGGQHQAGPAPTRMGSSPGSASSTATAVDPTVASSATTHPIGPPRRLDGGAFTWSNGVRMSLKIVRNQRWGRTTHYCYDPQCPVSRPDDRLVVLRYTVSVPKTLRSDVDPQECPGHLEARRGPEDDVLDVAGPYWNPVDDLIRPGRTVTGHTEYAIAKQVLGTRLELQSTCGIGDSLSEIAVFDGVIDAR